MYELVQLNENDYYIDCPSKIGIVKISDDEVVFIDAGNDKDAGKKAYRILEANGWKLKAIFNTHSHADHIGGNRFLQEKTGCNIYINEKECTLANEPFLEPVNLYGGNPFKDLKHKFLMAEKSIVRPLSEDVLPDGMKMIEMPGHSIGMTGYITKDGTAYIGDVVASEETIKKYAITYLWDPEISRASIDFLKTVEAKYYVASHAPVCEEIGYLADVNIMAINSIREKVMEICIESISFDDILKCIFDEYGLSMSAVQNALVGSTIRSYITDLYEHGFITYEFIDNKMMWKKV